MKNAVVLATAVVAAVILIQGATLSGSVTPSRSGADVVVNASATHSSTADLTAVFGGKASTASVAEKKAASSSSSSADSSASAATTTTVHAAGVSASASSSVTSGHTYTTDPATVTATPAPTQTPNPTPACASAIGGSTSGAPGASDAEGVPGTTTADLNLFASQYNALRVANCLQPIPPANIRYSTCLQQRMWWMADDPSTDSASAWGHTGTAVRSDGVPIVGCDGDLAGGGGYTAATVASAWWSSPDHRSSLYQPGFTGNVSGVCIAFAMTHGGINVPAPNEPASFVRAAAYWYNC